MNVLCVVVSVFIVYYYVSLCLSICEYMTYMYEGEELHAGHNDTVTIVSGLWSQMWDFIRHYDITFWHYDVTLRHYDITFWHYVSNLRLKNPIFWTHGELFYYRQVDTYSILQVKSKLLRCVTSMSVLM